MKHEFALGEFNEQMSWAIVEDVHREFDELHGAEFCSHVRHEQKGITIPAIVLARNEGGWNSTAVCLHCILENAHAMGIATVQLL